MTKKHFEAMAEYIRSHGIPKDDESAAFIRGMASLAIHMGRTFNPRFDVDRFRAACGEALEVSE